MADLAQPRGRRVLVALALALSIAAAGAELGGCGGGPAAATAKPIPVNKALAKRTAGGPNFIVILMDDQAQNSFRARYMPQTFRWIVRPGTNFIDGLAAPPLCCPDRAGFLTGDYPHNSGVFSNHPGYPTLRAKSNTLPVWMARAGYRTALIGKYLNHYYGTEGLTPAPGWQTWFSQTSAEQYYNYPVSDNGVQRDYGNARRDYSTDVFTRQSKKFVRSNAHSKRPFFLWLTYNAPHGVRRPGPGCGTHNPVPPNQATLRRFKHAGLPRTPAYNEKNVKDKPKVIRKLPRISNFFFRRIRRGWRCTLATMSAADHDIGKLMRTLKGTGQLSRTIVFYMSDNGFYFGEHRVYSGKQYPYEPALRVPYAVRVPARYRSRPQRARSHQLVSEIDATPTILQYARNVPSCKDASRCRRIDGRSMRPLLGGHGHWPSGRGVLAEIKADQSQYGAIRTKGWMYVRYDDGERELYNLRRDPNELRNLAGRHRYADVERKLKRRLAALERCSGSTGRHACK